MSIDSLSKVQSNSSVNLNQLLYLIAYTPVLLEAGS